MHEEPARALTARGAGSHGQEGLDRLCVLPEAATMGTAHARTGDQLLAELGPRRVFMMGDNPALPTMPPRPALADFFRLRLEPFTARHMLHSARRARELGLAEPVVLACLLHDISVAGLLRSHHGHWGAQMVAPYVSEEVAWAIRQHEILRFFPDASVGYDYPESYRQMFGPDYTPPAHVQDAWRSIRSHRWYMTARLVTLNDLYTFDQEEEVDIGEFEDVIGRHFRQPVQGLGFDGSPAAHMWRTMIWPNNFL
ncbi:HD domain-containing protein [Streptomyces sp. NPDC029674]|uniref:HD domain-containing protein n=1 Tax=Streptomyces sp. NPDC029674 TaxID=3365297 RepID=UPI00384F8C84